MITKEKIAIELAEVMTNMARVALKEMPGDEAFAVFARTVDIMREGVVYAEARDQAPCFNIDV
jgi:hypothetical protein